ncbi:MULTISPECIES: cyclopropane-fatty-acyl-phospholipid synthase family protein [unclassified Halomonas]|uniref:SAM-dependent methyltransferase n=1 Tax=unclassified Halomonas TaxID=2609666 RepID=UPI0005FA8262|nr:MULTISPECIES: cyclopropane-fatty-acyl-phospholipid synthase family protein [unclassified Halomonas]KJZ18743.1 cyclopropane-fatty-acyl-phospholipid synthase [Halomonas sp. S2151]MBY6112513.1 cyclopropane-fatty-acyl-phospholipid synthase family protein [Halomonas sp. DP1Y21-3]MCJ8287808.1 cyclopropane-fatty-acyl-phospholipid synthase family protein [Halomonas sp.]MCO7215865.1 cyclopropane-fatty-acyl-phospholipid synthase family protein [Halomonas sp. OfavH-34-E]NQY72528.1 class I SAM-dependen
MTTLRSEQGVTISRRGDRLSHWLKPRVLAQLGQLRHGSITLVDGHERHQLGEQGELSVTLVVRRSRVWKRMALGGTLGAAEAYMDGDWDVDDLVGLVRLFARNIDRVNDDVEGGLAGLGRALLSTLLRLQRNTRKGSRRHIAAHYDIGNDLFATFLDREHWMYSSAIFPSPEATLEQASTHKLDVMLDKLDVRPHHHLLEIGTGWGGLAIHAARTRGCRVTTTTISREQYEHTARRLAEEGLEDQVTLLNKDYRELSGRYDRLISVEMVEAVGADYLPRYLKTLDQLLAPQGLALLQAITVRDQRYEAARREMDFIKRYIFPGGFLPSPTVLLQNLTKHTSMNLVDLDDIGPHYARTLREWRQRFEASLDQVGKLGYDERFVRMWRYYLCYCEAGFAERTISTCHLLLAKPDARPRTRLGKP